jgi:hypothetical protein
LIQFSGGYSTATDPAVAEREYGTISHQLGWSRRREGAGWNLEQSRPGRGGFPEIRYNPSLAGMQIRALSDRTGTRASEWRYIGDPSDRAYQDPQDSDLFHELVHASDTLRGLSVEPGVWGSEIGVGVDEEHATGLGDLFNTPFNENLYRQERGLPLRTSYGYGRTEIYSSRNTRPPAYDAAVGVVLRAAAEPSVAQQPGNAGQTLPTLPSGAGQPVAAQSVPSPVVLRPQGAGASGPRPSGPGPSRPRPPGWTPRGARPPPAGGGQDSVTPVALTADNEPTFTSQAGGCQ